MTRDPDPAALPAVDLTRLGPAAGARVLAVGGCGGMGRRLVSTALALGLRPAIVDLDRAIADHPPPDGVPAIALGHSDATGMQDAVSEAIGSLGGLDHLVYLTGYTPPPTRVEAMTAAAWDTLMTVNLRGAAMAAGAALPALRASGGSVVLIASGLAVNVSPGTSAYSASKAGLIALAKGLARENAPAIRANCVAPGAVDTAFLSGGTAEGADENRTGWFFTSGVNEEVIRTTPMGRIAAVDDVLGPILFLMGDAARFITGQTLHVNGGRLMA